MVSEQHHAGMVMNDPYCPATLEIPTQPWTGYQQNYIPDFNNGCVCAANEIAIFPSQVEINKYEITTTEWIYPKPSSSPTTVILWDYRHKPGYSSDVNTGDPSFWGSYVQAYNTYIQYSNYNIISKKNKCLKCPKINGIQTVSSKGAAMAQDQSSSFLCLSSLRLRTSFFSVSPSHSLVL